MQTGIFLHGSQIRYASLGHAQVTAGAVAVPLPSLASYDTGRISRVVIRPLANPINWRDDGTDPTATTGFPLLADEVFVYDGADLYKFKLIKNTAATADVDVRIIYYGV